MKDNKSRNKKIIAVSIIVLIAVILGSIIISYYYKEKILYFDVLSINIIAVLFSLFLIYDGFREIDKRFISCLIKVSVGAGIFIIHLLEIIFISILR